MAHSAGTAPDALAGNDADILRQVREAQFSLIFNSNRSSSPMAFIVAVVFWGFLYWRTREQAALLWGLAMHACQWARYLWVARYFREPERAASDASWIRGYVGLLAASGVIWGAAPLVLFVPDDPYAMSFMVVTLLAIHSGGLTWMAPVRAAVIAFSVPIMVLMTAALLLQTDIAYRVAAVLSALYLYTSLKFSLQQNRLLSEALYHRFANAALSERLNRQVALVQRANDEKSRFLAAASHDLRQPLSAIALFSAALERKLAGSPLHEDARRNIQAVRALGDALDAMLDISKLDAGVIEVQPRALPLQRILRKLNETFQPQAQDKGLELRVRSTPLWVRSDEQGLERLLSNLVSNAIKYCERGGVLVVARSRGDEVWVDVRDTGIGIAPEHLDRVFDEFYQVGNPGRDRTKGLGLGLSIVRRLAALLGHRVTVRSAPQRGSCFRLALPAEAPRQEAEPDFSLSGRFTIGPVLPRRILIVDDEADILDGVASLLQNFPVEVLKAGGPDEALRHLRAQDAAAPVELMLCDLRLGAGGSGLELVERVRREIARPPRAVMMTGETGPRELQRLHDSGIPVLFKPVSGSRLVAELATRPAAQLTAQ